MKGTPAALNRVVATLLGVGTLLGGCGGGETETAPTETPAVVVESTPEPTPEPTPEAVLEPAIVYWVVFDETIEPLDLPTRSPLARDLAPRADRVPSAEFLEFDGASRVTHEALESLEDGFGASGQRLALVEWRIRWGDEGEAGRTRRWGLCRLPCRVEDSFVAGPEHFPVSQTAAPRALFALRPGAEAVTLSEMSDGVEIRHGDALMWPDGVAAAPVQESERMRVAMLDADGVIESAVVFEASRTLAVLTVGSKEYPLTSARDPIADSTRLLPRLGATPHTPRRLAVQGVVEEWPWPEAERFEGGFTAKPSPADYGLQFDRIARIVRWLPTTRQAGDGKATFATYSLKRSGGIAISITPFPDGADVLGGTEAVDGRVVIANKGGFEVDQRGEQVAAILESYAERLPLDDPAEDATVPASVVYVVPEPTGVLLGSAGPSPNAVTVSDAPGEEESIARAWTSLLLGPSMASRSPAAIDFGRWVRGTLVEGVEDRSVFMHTFAASGDDILAEWRRWLVDPARGGAPEPTAFIEFVGGQLPDLAAKMSRSMVERSFVVGALPEPVNAEPGAATWSAQLVDPGAQGVIVAVELPPGASQKPVDLSVEPTRAGVPVQWAAALVAERYWQEAVSDRGAKEALLQRLGATEGLPETEEAEETPAPVTAPSQRAALAGARVRTRPKRISATKRSLAHEDSPVGDSVVLLLVWGPAEWTANVKVTAAEPMPEAEPVESVEPPPSDAGHGEPGEAPPPPDEE